MNKAIEKAIVGKKISEVSNSVSIEKNKCL